PARPSPARPGPHRPSGVQQRPSPGEPTSDRSGRRIAGPVLPPAGRAGNAGTRRPPGTGAVQQRSHPGGIQASSRGGTGGQLLGRVTPADRAEAPTGTGHAGVLGTRSAGTGRRDPRGARRVATSEVRSRRPRRVDPPSPPSPRGSASARRAPAP